MDGTMESMRNEIDRIKKISETLDGLMKIKHAYSGQFSSRFFQVSLAITEIARVNVIRLERGEVVLL